MNLQGRCYPVFCFDVGRDLDPHLAEQRLAGPRHRLAFRHRRHASAGALETTHSLRTTVDVEPLPVAAWSSTAEVGVAMHSLGSVVVTWTFPFDGSLEDLVAFSAALADDRGLVERSRAICRGVLDAIGDAVVDPADSEGPEDYLVVHLPPPAGPGLLEEVPGDLARVLRAEAATLSDQEVEASLANRVAYTADEVVVVDWLAALLLAEEVDDELLLLEHANVELLQLRSLDARLAAAVDDASDALGSTSRRWGPSGSRRADLARIARMQVDDAVLHEGFDNPLRLFGDDYLARLYRAVSDRFHFAERDGSIQRKLGVLDSIYQKLADRAAHRRSELLEWIIIVLIAFEVVSGLMGRVG